MQPAPLQPATVLQRSRDAEQISYPCIETIKSGPRASVHSSALAGGHLAQHIERPSNDLIERGVEHSRTVVFGQHRTVAAQEHELAFRTRHDVEVDLAKRVFLQPVEFDKQSPVSLQVAPVSPPSRNSSTPTETAIATFATTSPICSRSSGLPAGTDAGLRGKATTAPLGI